MKTILLTGGTGYIGSHTAILFLQKGYEVVILDNLYNSDRSVLNVLKKITGRSAKFYEGNICDKKILQRIFSENKIDSVIHFAGLKAVGESCEKPFLYYENNIVGSLSLFEVMNDFGVKDIIFSSTGSVYTNNQTTPFSEDSRTGNTTNPYSTTKFIIENLLRDLVNHKGFRVINLRYFNPIGAHKSGLLGEDPNDIPNNLLPYLMKVLLGDLEYLKVFGSDYPTKDGTGERDYIHVLDVADAHYNSLKCLLTTTGKVYEEINIGTGKLTSVLEIIKLTEDITNFHLPYNFVERRKGDLISMSCSPKKAEKLLKWKAKFSVREAIEDQYNFIIKTMKNKSIQNILLGMNNDKLYIYKLQYKKIINSTLIKK